MKKATFEVATLADSIAKANRIAPRKGLGADLAAGIFITVNPSNDPEPVIVASTDLQVTFRQVVSVLSLGDEPARWRVPSELIAGFIGTLPMESGSEVTLADRDDGSLYFKCGKTKGSVRQIMGDAPKIEPYDPTTLGVVQGLARRLTQVAWAVDQKSTGPLSGIHLDGEYLIATDTSKAVIVPCKVPLDRPVTSPLSGIASLLKNTGDLSMRASDNHLHIMPDKYTQTKSILFEGEYPNIKKLLDLDSRFTASIDVSAEQLKASIDRMLVLVKQERLPAITIEIGMDVMRLEMEVPEVGRISDEIEAKGGDTETFTVSFTPQNLASAITSSGRPTVTIDYGPTPLSMMRVRDDNEYAAFLMPRRPT